MLKYDAHINVEVCGSVQSIKYFYKYVYKGHDCATLDVCFVNEMKDYIDCRYVSSNEAAWRILEFEISKSSHSVERLDLYLPGQQPVYFREGNEVQQIEQAAARDSKLSAFFKLAEGDLEARQLLYTEVPKYYTWQSGKHKWKHRL